VFIVKHGVVIMTNYAAMRDLTDALTNPAKDELTEVQLDDVTGAADLVGIVVHLQVGQ